MKVVYAGSFDPITNGHLQVIKAAIELFDDLDILVANNRSKNHLFSIENRAIMVEKAILGLNYDVKKKKINVVPHEGITADYLNIQDVKVFIRGLRNGIDLNYELQNEQFIKGTSSAITIYITPDAQHSFTSSSLIRDFYKTGYIQPISNYVPAAVFECLKGFFKNK